ncbi:TTL10-like protein [Mya arenaria]|uniref:TTL10-like protein n=1 Tax=Mya arenaria TaxID=6604 RepID=A0ABY7F1U6_MYAAR|nr:TTL10-like protein [Mya arenaria]
MTYQVTKVEAPLVNIGWKRTTDKYDERFRLKWVECKSKINYGGFKEESYKLDEKSDRELFLEVYKDNEIWICKPVGMNQGKGIFLIRSREAITQLLEERDQKKQQPQKPGRPLMNRIVQRYILNPLLLDGRKFDVRAYMLVASTTPFLILYHKGYFVQKKDPNYKQLKEDTAWTMDKFNDYKQMQKIMIHCFNSVKHKLQSRVGFFDLFGLDFMIDTDMRVFLLEINVNPSLSRAFNRDVSIECFEKSRKNQTLMPLQSLKNFTILYCGTRPNTIVPRQSRSVSPVKDINPNTAEKPRLSMAGSRSIPRASTQSTPLSNQRRSSDRTDANQSSSISAKSGTNSASVKTGAVSKTRQKSIVDADSIKSKEADNKASGNKSDVGEKDADKNHPEKVASDNKDDDTSSVKSSTKVRTSTVVIDTLSKTTDSLNQATTALSRLSPVCIRIYYILCDILSFICQKRYGWGIDNALLIQNYVDVQIY